MADIQFGAKLMLDGSVWVNGIQAATSATSKFGDTARKAGDDAAAGMDRAAKATQAASAAAEQYNQSARSSSEILAAQRRQMEGVAAAGVEGADGRRGDARRAARARRRVDPLPHRRRQVLSRTARDGQGSDLLHRSLQAGLVSQTQYEARLAALTARYGPAASGAAQAAHGIEGIGISAGFAAREARALTDELACRTNEPGAGNVHEHAGRLAMAAPVAVGLALSVSASAPPFAYGVIHAESLNRSLAQTQAMLTRRDGAGNSRPRS
jgi:hypothetical protein